MANRDPIRVIIVDDQAVVRSGLGAFLMAFDDLQLVGEAENGEEAIQLCELVQPDVVLMDLKMPQMDGIQATSIIRQRWPNIQILVLTSFKDKEVIQGALDAGATGYLLKNLTADELAEAILEVHKGRRTVAHEAKQTLVQAEHLERLASEIKDAAPEKAQIVSVLEKRVPNIFPHCEIMVRIFPDQVLFSYPGDSMVALPESAWNWLRTNPEPQAYAPGDKIPWGGRQENGRGLILAPIPGGSGKAVGGIRLFQNRDPEDIEDLLPFVESLTTILASVIDQHPQGENYSPQQKATQELMTAGKIQEGILPDKAPIFHGWDLTAKVDPARETSGDFYDFIPLDKGKLGIVIADVTDKGLGAALFMALSSTLIRTYATQYPTLPAFAFGSVNERILSDTRGGMFVTAFYGVLEPDTGRMRYVNAGHNPPLHISNQKGKPVDKLRGTGMALGVMESATWQQKIAKFIPGDILLMYTDGVTEAQNAKGQYFGEQRLIEVVRANVGRTAREIQSAVLKAVYDFIGEAPKQDDITLVVMVRK